MNPLLDTRIGGFLPFVDRTEGGGRYDTLFAHAQRTDTPLRGVDITGKTIDELRQFSGPQGPYGQWSRQKLGYRATPMGRFQFVGTTMAEVADRMGLSGDTLFTPEVQNAMFENEVSRVLSSARSRPAQRQALRGVWEGFKNASDAELDRAIEQFQTGAPVEGAFQTASSRNVPMPPPRPGGLGGLGGTEPPAAYASMASGPAPSAQGGGDPNQTVPAAMMALNAGDDRAPRAEAFGQTIPSLQRAGIQPRQPFSGRASGLDSFGPGGPQPFAANGGPAALGARGGGVAAMERNPMSPPAPNMTPRPATPPSFMPGGAQSQAQGVPSFAQGSPPPIRVQQGMPPVVGAVQGASAGPPMPNVSAVAQAAQPQQPQQPPMPPPRPSNIGGQNMPRGIDPNQYAGGEWIPPDVGRQLAAQQMGGQANMPAQGAQAAQGGGIAPSAPQGSPGGLGGLGGLRGPLHAAFLSMLTSNDRRAPFANMPQFMQQQMEIDQQMQAQRQAQAQEAESQRFRQTIAGGGDGFPGGAAPAEGQAGAGQAGNGTGNRTLDSLYARRSQIARAIANAPTKQDADMAQVLLDDLDRQIERFEKQAGFRRASPEQAAEYGAAAGQFGPDGRFYPINPPSGMSIESDGQGGFRLTQGPGAGASAGSPGLQKIDEEFGKEYVQWRTGGAGDTVKQLDQLNEALQIVETTEGITGPIIGSLPEFAQAVINQDGVIARDYVEEVVQRNLRIVLGAQFTEKEGERLIARAYNSRLPPAENARRIRRLITQVQSMAQAKEAAAQYFEQNGTLQGFTGGAALDPQNIYGMSFDDEGTLSRSQSGGPRRMRFNPETGELE